MGRNGCWRGPMLLALAMTLLSLSPQVEAANARQFVLEKGCTVVLDSTPDSEDGATKLKWSGPCERGQPVSGKGDLDIEIWWPGESEPAFVHRYYGVSFVNGLLQGRALSLAGNCDGPCMHSISIFSEGCEERSVTLGHTREVADLYPKEGYVPYRSYAGVQYYAPASYPLNEDIGLDNAAECKAALKAFTASQPQSRLATPTPLPKLGNGCVEARSVQRLTVANADRVNLTLVSTCARQQLVAMWMEYDYPGLPASIPHPFFRIGGTPERDYYDPQTESNVDTLLNGTPGFNIDLSMFDLQFRPPAPANATLITTRQLGVNRAYKSFWGGDSPPSTRPIAYQLASCDAVGPNGKPVAMYWLPETKKLLCTEIFLVPLKQ